MLNCNVIINIVTCRHTWAKKYAIIKYNSKKIKFPLKFSNKQDHLKRFDTPQALTDKSNLLTIRNIFSSNKNK